MRINSITAGTSYLTRAKESSMHKERECAEKRNNIYKNNNDKINATIKRNSDGRVSFKGGTPFLHKVANFASESPLVAEAIFAILITCGLRPLTIMSTAKTEADKEKCSYQAAKSVSTGVVGLAMSVLVGIPIAAAAKAAQKKGVFKMTPEMKEKAKEVVKKGAEALDDFGRKLTSGSADDNFAKQVRDIVTKDGGLNLKIFKKGQDKKFIGKIKEEAPDIFETVKAAILEQKSLDNFERTGKNIIDKLFQPIFMPLRATIVVALVNPILKALGLKKSPKKIQQTNPYDTLKFNVFQNNTEKELFQSFQGVTSYENK